MPHSPGIAIYLPIITPLKRLIPEKVYSRVLNAVGHVDLVLHVLQAVGFVPALGEDVEADLAADGVARKMGQKVSETSWVLGDKGGKGLRETIIRELAFNSLNKLLPNPMLQIKNFILPPLLLTSVPANGADINHAVSELHKRAPLHRNFQVGDVVQQEAHEFLIPLLPDPGDEVLVRERLAHAKGCEAVFRKAKVEEGLYGDLGGCKLFLLFEQVGAAYEADCDAVPEGGKEGEHCWGDCAAGRCEGAIDVEEAEGFLYGALGE